jgi:hypothetical protein
MFTVGKSRCILASWRSQLDIWFQLAKIWVREIAGYFGA